MFWSPNLRTTRRDTTIAACAAGPKTGSRFRTHFGGQGWKARLETKPGGTYRCDSCTNKSRKNLKRVSKARPQNWSNLWSQIWALHAAVCWKSTYSEAPRPHFRVQNLDPISGPVFRAFWLLQPRPKHASCTPFPQAGGATNWTRVRTEGSQNESRIWPPKRVPKRMQQ